VLAKVEVPVTFNVPPTVALPVIEAEERVDAPADKVPLRVVLPVTPNVPPILALLLIVAEDKVVAPADKVPATVVLPVAVSTKNLVAGVAAPSVIRKYSVAAVVEPDNVNPLLNCTLPIFKSVPVMFRLPPTYKSPAIPTPPATVNAPVVELVEAVVLSICALI